MGNVIAVSGTAPIKNSRTTCIGDVYGQTKYGLSISIQAIEEAGGKAGDIIRTRIMLTGISKWKQAAKAHGELFSRIMPACTFEEVSRFIELEWLVETEIDYIVNEK